MGLFDKIFGSYSDREVKRIAPIVDKVDSLGPEIEKLSDEELKQKTFEFKERYAKGESLDDMLPEAFAVCREASNRVLGMKHYREQLIGGTVLHQGRIAEMKTGEGKTLVATLPAYLNAIAGKGVHVITVNDYLATRDKEWMEQLYGFLGLTTGVIVHGLTNDQRREAYNADITYGTNNEYGFDYLKDNMVIHKEQRVQRPLNYAIVDEVDSILIDEARTPLIISGPGDKSTHLYSDANTFVLTLKPDDYELEEKQKAVSLTESGIQKAEVYFNVENITDISHTELYHHINQALKAHVIMKRDVDYVCKDGEIVIVDEFTGRLMFGRRYSEGLHQAIEAKEGLRIQRESKTLATITFQNYFRMYNKLSGMTGTAETEAAEFVHTYGLQIVVIPTNKPVVRKDHADLVYKTRKEKIDAIVARIHQLYEKGQPVLVGTISIKSSEELSQILKDKKIPHNVLNAKYHAKEAEIVAQAGRYKAVTIATNMAGRGTDIMLGGNPEFLALAEAGSKDNEKYPELLEKYTKQCAQEGEKVKSLGGLFILGTERHESRRIDNQLRGRAGRQGDPGESEFYLSLEDDLMRLFGSDRVKHVMEKLGLPEGEPITHSMINKAIANAQNKIESRNFGIRKNLLEFDDVMNKQRTAVYASRNEAMSKDDLKDSIIAMLHETIYSEVAKRFQGEYKEDWDILGLVEYVKENYRYEITDTEEYKSMTIEEYSQKLFDGLVESYNQKEEKLGRDIMRRLEKYILFEVTDSRWREHLKALDGLKEGIYLRAYGQRDPVVEYKLISGDLYEQMIETIKAQTTSFLFKVIIKDEEEEKNMKMQNDQEEIREYTSEDENGVENVSSDEVSEDSPCPCGSGKKYKNCCGRL